MVRYLSFGLWNSDQNVTLDLFQSITAANSYTHIRDMTKSWKEWKMESQTERLNFIEKLYFIIVDLFCRYNSDNNKTIAYINR